MKTLRETLEPFRTAVMGPTTMQEMAVAVQKWAEENNCIVYPTRLDGDACVAGIAVIFNVTFECVPKT